MRLSLLAAIAFALLIGNSLLIVSGQDEAPKPKAEEKKDEAKPDETKPGEEKKEEAVPKDEDGNPIENPFPQRIPAPSLDGGEAWLNTSGEITLKDLRGKVVLLDFWGTW